MKKGWVARLFMYTVFVVAIVYSATFLGTPLGGDAADLLEHYEGSIIAGHRALASAE